MQTGEVINTAAVPPGTSVAVFALGGSAWLSSWAPTSLGAAHAVAAGPGRLVGSYMGASGPQRDMPRLVDLHLAGRLPSSSCITDLDGLHASLDAIDGATVLCQIVIPGAKAAVTAP